MIISFHVKLDKFCCTGAMDYLKMIRYDLFSLFIYFLCSYKNDLLFFNREESLQKAKDRYHNCGGKEKAPEYYIANKEVLK